LAKLFDENLLSEKPQNIGQLDFHSKILIEILDKH